MSPLSPRGIRSGELVMDTRTLLAVVLSMVILIGFQFLVSQNQPAVSPQKPVARQQEAPKPVSPPPVADTEVSQEREIKVETDLYKAVFSSKGAVVKYWEIKNYKDKIGKDIVLLKGRAALPPLCVGGDTNFDLMNENFEVKGGDIRLDANNKSAFLKFEFSKSGRAMTRTYVFHNDRYDVDLTDEMTGFPEYWITLGSDFGISDNQAGYTHVGPVLLKGTDLEELKPKKLKEPQTYTGDIKWIGQEDKYFCAALVPSFQPAEAKAWTYKDSPVIAIKGKPSSNIFHLYAGPKEHGRLAALKSGLEYIIDYGFFSVIARPLFWVLKFFYRYVGNYGWAIILLTIVVRIPFIPLVSKGQRSMKKLQEIQPKMNEIREKYKKDPQKMQQEMMELYKKYKVNPMGGCLPMVLQIPVFFALYKVLLVSIELRGAPFMLWITDLSAPDTLFGHIAGFSLGGPLPYLMGITMIIQQKMTPSGMDPKQAKMMMLMPVIFTFMFLNFASGLVLYWLVNNLLSIGQQFFINKKTGIKAASAS